MSPPWTPPPPPPLPMLEAGSQNFASAPLAPRGLKLQNFRPAFSGGPGRRGVPATPPPSDPPLTPPPPLLIHPCQRGLKSLVAPVAAWPSAKQGQATS